MGYRSDVVIRIDSNAVTKEFEKGLKEHEIDYQINEFCLEIELVSVKWYPDIEAVKFIIHFLDKLADNQYGLIEIGEGENIRTEGEYWEFDLGYSVTITKGEFQRSPKLSHTLKVFCSSSKMKLSQFFIDKINECVDKKDPVIAGQISETFRFKAGLNYTQIYEQVIAVAEISLDEWDTLLYEADILNSQTY